MKKMFFHGLKLALVVRSDLQMKKGTVFVCGLESKLSNELVFAGKIAAQCCHAAVGCYRQALRDTPELLAKWEMMGEPKVIYMF